MQSCRLLSSAWRSVRISNAAGPFKQQQRPTTADQCRGRFFETYQIKRCRSSTSSAGSSSRDWRPGYTLPRPSCTHNGLWRPRSRRCRVLVYVGADSFIQHWVHAIQKSRLHRSHDPAQQHAGKRPSVQILKDQHVGGEQQECHMSVPLDMRTAYWHNV